MANKFKTKTTQRVRVQFTPSDLPSVTNQQWKDETNINYIIKHCTPDSLNQSLQTANAQMAFGEMVEANQQLNLLYEHTKQKEEFNCLPSEIRKQYNYDFKTFLVESSTPQGIDKLVDLGLLPESYKNAKVDVSVENNSSVSSEIVEEQIKNI